MKKILKYIGLIFLTLILVQIGRTLYSAGVFQKVQPHQTGTFQVFKGMKGAEDLTIDPQTGIALVSSHDRRNMDTRGAIYAFNVQADPPVLTNLTSDLALPEFYPHGLSLYYDPADSTKWLFVVNHPNEGDCMEIFQYTDSTLVWKQTIRQETFKNLNDVVGVGKNAFYFTNDHESKKKLAKLKDFVMIGNGQIGYADESGSTILKKGIPYANGINVSKDGEYLYVASTTGRKILVYQRDPFVKITEISCKTGVDNIELDAEGNLWIGAHPKLLAFVGHAKDSTKSSPSQVLKITFADANPASARVSELYLNDGKPLSGSSTAAVYQDYLVIGTVFEDGVMVGKIKNSK